MTGKNKICALAVIAFVFAMAVCPCRALGGECEPPPYQYAETKQLMSLVEKAASLIRAGGEEVFPDFSRSGSPWLHDDQYVFVVDLHGNFIVHPFGNLQGRNQLHYKDSFGKPLVQWFIAKTSRGEGTDWCHYMWPKPYKKSASWKSAFIKKVEAPSGNRYIVGAGLYDMPIEKAFIVNAVNSAVAMIGEEGVMAFDKMRTKSSEFVFLNTYVFVIQADGTEVVNPYFPGREGRNLLDLKNNGALEKMLSALNNRQCAWVKTTLPKPAGHIFVTRESYVRKVKLGEKEYIVGCER